MKQKTINRSDNGQNALSFHQKSNVVSLAIISIATMYFIAKVWSMPARDLANNVIPAGYGGLILTTVLLIIVAQIGLQIVLVFGAGSAGEVSAVEKTAVFKATRNAYAVLTVGVFTAVASLFWGDWLPLYTTDLLIVGFALAEIVKYASQLFYSRQ